MTNSDRISGRPLGKAAPIPEIEEQGEPFRLFFICTGNTCRSPLAEAIARKEIERLGWRRIEVGSAGVAATSGSPASEGARRAGERHGIDLSRHRSRQLTQKGVSVADLLLVMTPAHLAFVRQLGGEEKSALLTEFAEGVEATTKESRRDISDPFGGGDVDYENTYVELSDLLPRVLGRLAPLIVP